MLLEIIATLAAGLFAGAAIYIDLAEQPARKQIDTATALTEWRPSYKRAAVVQLLLAAVGFLSAVAAWLMGGSVWWLVGGVLLVAVQQQASGSRHSREGPGSGTAIADPVVEITHGKKHHELGSLVDLHAVAVSYTNQAGAPKGKGSGLGLAPTRMEQKVRFDNIP